MQLGCDPELRNRKGKTAADIVADATVWDNLISYVNRRNDLLSAEDGAVSPELVQEESCKKEEQSTLIATSSSVPSAKECIVCYDTAPDIRFEPCGHTNTCSHCAPRMKKCLECHVIITTKTSAGTFAQSQFIYYQWGKSFLDLTIGKTSQNRSTFPLFRSK